MNTRRDFFKLGLIATPAARLFAKSESKVRGVMIGVQSYSFRDRPLDQAIKDIAGVGLSYCELSQGHVEPKEENREQIRKWRETVSIPEFFGSIGRQFRDAGIRVYAYNYSFRDDFSDKEIERGFEMAKGLGAKAITASSNVDMAKRIDPYARRFKMMVGMHNHDSMKPNEFSTPEDFAAAMRGESKYIGVNLDVGHFTAANFDPVKYIEEHHDRIVTLHIKDRKKNHGENFPFGEGETPIREVLKVLESKKYRIPAMIEYEYNGTDPVAEVRRSYEYMRKALET